MCNQNQDHWVLVIFAIHEHLILYLDPMNSFDHNIVQTCRAVFIRAVEEQTALGCRKSPNMPSAQTWEVRNSQVFILCCIFLTPPFPNLLNSIQHSYFQKLPKQPDGNTWDYGVFVLEYLTRFIQGPFPS